MIELTQLSIAMQADVIEVRNKILLLFLELKFSEMESVNFTAKISDFIHHISLEKKLINIKICFETKPSLVLVLQIQLPTVSASFLKNFSLPLGGNVVVSEDKKGCDVFLRFPLNAKKHHFDDAYMQKLKEKLIMQSKSELMREINHKNEELKNLLEDLKKSSGLIQSEKMRALGILTAGVAHELNNPMMGILNFVQYCLKKTEQEDKRYEALKDAEQETKRCIEIVANLLTFSHLEKEGTENFKPVNMGVIVERVAKILTYRLRNEAVSLDMSYPENIPLIMGHENRLQQVILNLVTNALDAMKGVKQKKLDLKMQSINDNLKIIIADSGEGMEEETMKKIFEPFFTTKPTGSGTGLGLSVCDSIIREHGGNIVCHSKLNEGTQFSVILPITSME